MRHVRKHVSFKTQLFFDFRAPALIVNRTTATVSFSCECVCASLLLLLFIDDDDHDDKGLVLPIYDPRINRFAVVLLEMLMLSRSGVR